MAERLSPEKAREDLKRLYDRVVDEPVPGDMKELLEKLK
jgi:hypothetical protein